MSIWWWWWLGGGGLGVGFGAIMGVALGSFFTGAEVDTGETLVLGLRVGDKVGVALGFTLIGVAVGTLCGRLSWNSTWFHTASGHSGWTLSGSSGSST